MLHTFSVRHKLTIWAYAFAGHPCGVFVKYLHHILRSAAHVRCDKLALSFCERGIFVLNLLCVTIGLDDIVAYVVVRHVKHVSHCTLYLYTLKVDCNIVCDLGLRYVKCNF